MALDKDNEYFGNDPEVVELVRKMVLFDDNFMSAVFSDYKLAEYLLKILINKDLTVIDTDTQHEIKNIYGRSVKLDIYAQDSEGKLYDIEVQRDNRGALPRRARYNNALMDSNALKAGEDFDKLPETYIIFITENDVLGENEPIYEIERVIRKSGTLFDDGTHIVFVNGKNRDNTDLGKLMADFAQNDPSKFYHKILGEAVHHYKYTEEGVNTMCKLVEDYGDKRAKEIALGLITNGKLSYEEIAELTKLTLEEVKELAEKTSA